MDKVATGFLGWSQSPQKEGIKMNNEIYRAEKLKLGLIIIGFLVTALSCSLGLGTEPVASPEEMAELREAYENYLAIAAEAYRTGDESHLAEAATGDSLAWIKRSVQQTHASGRHEWAEYSQVYFKVTSYDSEVAEALFRASRKSYTFDPETGGRHFVGSRPELHEITFVKEAGIWKVSHRSESIID